MAYRAINYSPDQSFGSPAGGSGSYAYNANPSPRGTGGILGDIFGRVPGVVQMPQPYEDLSQVYPQLKETNAAGSENILSDLMGELSPSTLTAINGAADRYGIDTTGINLQTPRTLGETSDQLVDRGLQEVNPFTKTLSTTQTVSPETQAMIAQFNAMNSAAQDPGKSGIASTALGLVGGVVGSYFGGPVGGKIGGSLGQFAGSSIDGTGK